MVPAESIRLPPKRDAAVARVIRSWRELTGGGRDGPGMRRTLVACSGGADSSALALCLAAAGGEIALGHVVHDLRSAVEAEADRDSVRRLAEVLDRPFFEQRVEVKRAGGNLEAAARRLRYAALGAIAAREGYAFIATAHHAEDQLETMLLRLLRGAGPRGLAGIAVSRRMGVGEGTSVQVIRPMLGVGRDEAEQICLASGWRWQVDATNADVGRDRNFLRARVIPLLLDRFPAAAERASDSAALMGSMAGLLSRDAEALPCERSAGEVTWPRRALREVDEVVAAEALRLGFAWLGGGKGMDRVGSKRLREACRVIRSNRGGLRKMAWPGVVVEVTKTEVHMKLEAVSDG